MDKSRPTRSAILRLLDLRLRGIDSRSSSASKGRPVPPKFTTSPPVEPAHSPEEATERLLAAAERACEALGWLGSEARHAAERDLRAAIEELRRVRGPKD